MEALTEPREFVAFAAVEELPLPRGRCVELTGEKKLTPHRGIPPGVSRLAPSQRSHRSPHRWRNEMSLHLGDEAPDFTAMTTDGEISFSP